MAKAKATDVFAHPELQRTIVVVDLVRYSDIVKSLQINHKLGANATLFLNKQIKGLIRQALKLQGAKRTCFVKSTGDGGILQFENPIIAERFAVALHEISFEQHCKNATSPLEWRSFRVGIFSGEVVLPFNEIAGAVVGYAQRLEAGAGAGEILIDASSWTQLTREQQAFYDREETLQIKRHDPLFKVHRRRVVEPPPWEVPKEPTRETVWYLPDRDRHPNFIGRTSEIEVIRSYLESGRIAAVTEVPDAGSARRIAALVGLGGIGKTETAIEYAFRYSNNYDYIFFLHAADVGKIQRDYVQIAALLKLSPWEKTLDGCAQAVLAWMSKNPGWLLIVDNVDNPEDVARYVPTKTAGHVLVTTRKKNLDPLAPGYVSAIPIGVFSADDSQTFMRLATGRNIDGNLSEEKALQELTEAMGGLPVALEQAATYIRTLPCSFVDYWEEFRQRRTELFVGALARPRWHEGVLTSEIAERDTAVTTTWDINFRRVESEAKKHPNTPQAAAPDLMLVSAFLSPDDIPMDLLSAGASELGERVEACLAGPRRLRVNEALYLLDQFSLIDVKIETRAYRMHRLVQEVIRRWWMTPEQRLLWAKRVIRVLQRGTLALHASEGNWPAALKDQHFTSFVATVLMDEWKAEEFEFEEAANLLSQSGFLLTKMGQFQEADRFLERAISIYEKVHGPDHLEIAQTLSNFANNLADWRRDIDALPYYERALRIRRQSQHKDHSDLAQVHNDYGIAYYHLRQYERAEEHYLEALRIWEKTQQDNLVGSAHFNLAMIYMGDPHQEKKATRHFRQAYDNVTTTHMRAQVCREFGNFIARHSGDDEALPMLYEGLKLAKRTFGDESESLLDYYDALKPCLARLARHDELKMIRFEEDKIRKRKDPFSIE